MKRWHEEVNITNKNWLNHKSLRPFHKERGKFRKTDAYDCGNAQCWICHNDKYPRRSLTLEEKRNLISFKEQLKKM